MSKLVSVIIPAYNAEKTIEDCVYSVSNQTYKEIEIIVINDGSSDNTLKILNTISKQDNRLFIKDIKNQGVSHARNTGIDLAKGDFIVFIDSDDQIDEIFIEELLENYKEKTLPICNYEKISNGNLVINQSPTSNQVYLYNNEEIFQILFLKRKLVNPPWGKLYNTSIITKNKIKFNENLSLGEDLLFNLEYFKYIQKFVFIDKPLYKYAVDNNNSLSKKYYKDMLNIQTIIVKELTNFIKKININEVVYKKIRLECLNMLMSAITNELRNSRRSKIKNAKKIMSKKEFQFFVEELKAEKCINNCLYLILKARLIIPSLLVKKILLTKIRRGE